MIKNYVDYRKDGTNKIVLVGVLKSRRDLDLLLTENWYRIPVARAPKLRFHYLAFYEPAVFGRRGKCIRYYARVLSHQTVKRMDLLPAESTHLKARDYYFRIRVDRVRKLPRPIRNIIPRRVSFGFTTLDRLLGSKNILQVYDVVPTEQFVGDGLKSAGIKAASQYHVLGGKKRYRLDFAVFCRKGAIAIECDNKKAHSGLRQREKDGIKDNFLRRRGWVVIRLREYDIVSDLNSCILRIKRAVRKLGGLGVGTGGF
jgi:very-short-patch-repair endonuclease